MIRVKRSRVFESVFTRYNTWMLRRHFSSLRLRGYEHVRELDRSRPIVFYGNHSCWWDGLIEYYLSRQVFGFEPYLMMDETQMSRYRFFRRIGAFSVNRGVPREAASSLRYAISLFGAPNRVLWIYPQGVMRPNDSRPLAFYGGVVRIAQGIGMTQLVPIAHRYEFMKDQKPDAFLSIGKPRLVEKVDDRDRLTGELEATLTDLLDDLRARIADERLDDFNFLLKGILSTNLWYDRLLGRGNGT